MPILCPNCDSLGRSGSRFIGWGSYYRTSDSQTIRRYRCRVCLITCSPQSSHAWFRQKKRQKNEDLRKHFASAGSSNRAARNFCLNRKTVARKLIALGFAAEAELGRSNRLCPKAKIVEFDDLETFEHTKCKPISVTIAVEHRTRRILGVEVSTMPAKGRLVAKARKYGPRIDGRRPARQALFERIQELVAEDVILKSDSNPHYPRDVRKFFPKGEHWRYGSRKSSLGGQGELKKVRFDPLFSLNHTCAKFRDDVKRLARRTWCTTKKIERLRAHLMIYAVYHNEHLA